jgi:hypothetical protein
MCRKVGRIDFRDSAQTDWEFPVQNRVLICEVSQTDMCDFVFVPWEQKEEDFPVGRNIVTRFRKDTHNRRFFGRFQSDSRFSHE